MCNIFLTTNEEAMSIPDDGDSVIIITHPGVFHADEVMAIAILTFFLDGDIDIHVVRTRDIDSRMRVDYMLDVGGEYDPEKKRFDHHMIQGAGKRNNNVPYATAGLVWNYIFDIMMTSGRIFEGLTYYQIDEIHKIVDQNLIQGIDALDNGYDVGQLDVPCLNISRMISNFNQTWEEKGKQFDDTFEQAVKFASMVLYRTITSAKAQVTAEDYVLQAFKNSSYDGIMVLDKLVLPWARSLHELDPTHYKVNLVIFPDESGEYWVQSPNIRPGDPNLVCPLPKEWRGKNGEELVKICGVKDAVFCHRNGFVAGSKSLEGATLMARTAIALHKKMY